MKDPIKANKRRIKALKAEIARLREENARMSEERMKWPKLVRVSVSKGKWGEEVLEAFATQCGFEVKDDTYLGPISNGKYIAAQAWLIYEVHEDGTCKLVGAEDQDFGKVGKCELL